MHILHEENYLHIWCLMTHKNLTTLNVMCLILTRNFSNKVITAVHLYECIKESNLI